MRSRRIKTGGMTEDSGSPLSKVCQSHIYLLARFRLRRKLQGKTFPPLPDSPKVPPSWQIITRVGFADTELRMGDKGGGRRTCIEVRGHNVVVLL